MLKKAGIIVLSIAVLLLGAFTLFTSGEAEAEKNAGNKGNQGKVKNVIFMIPDGFNGNYATNYRWYNGGESSFDQHVKGLMQTYSADTEVTDSAAAGTAMATGEKTNNGMVGVDPDGRELDSILVAAEKAGKATGLVATSTITHATPAAFASNVPSRGDEADIAPQYFENEVDVLLGGGREFFLPESEGGSQPAGNLIEQAEGAGYQYVSNRDELLDAKGKKLLGLFSESAMSPEMHRDQQEEPSLKEMTEAALGVLDKEKKGFFLMVEGSQIDWAGHAHDAAWAMTDIKAFDEAVEAALDFAKKDKRTLVVVAGDHETGGMSVGSNGEYDLKIEELYGVTATGDHMAEELDDERSNIAEVVNTYTGFDLSEEEVARIEESDEPNIAINDVVSDRALIGWTSTAHTGADLPVYAYGPQSDKFSGLLENTDLPKIMAEAMKIKLDN